MHSLLTGFRRRPVLAASLAALYYVAVVASHDLVQDLAYWLQRTIGPSVWPPVVAAGALVSAAWIARRALGVLRGGARPRPVAVAWWGTLAACAAASVSLLATNMEVVHFLQYALLALPVVALTGRFGNAVLVVTALGAFDELYQWVVLHPGWAVRFDANDVVLNALGGALGCAAAMVFGGVADAGPANRRSLALTWAPLLATALLLGGGGPVMAASHRLAVYRGDWCPHAWVTLSRAGRPQARWQSPPNARSHYVMHPGAMLAICLAIAGAFCALDGRVRLRGD